MLISIVVPVYNAEKFLPKSLESLQNQTYTELEIILVNDGSNDGSAAICEQYASTDKRFVVIHKENGGVSSARNAGLKRVTGEYVGFVDPDDWIEPDMFKRLYQLTQEYNADISMCGYMKEKADGTILNTLEPPSVTSFTSKEALNTILNDDSFRGFLWNKLFSAAILKENPSLKLDENIHFCEDLLFCCKAILASKSLVYDSTPFYHYMFHDNNASSSQYSLKKLTSLEALEQIIEMLSEEANVNVSMYKSYYMRMNLSLLMNGIYENKSSTDTTRYLKKNLFKYSLSELNSKSLQFSCRISRLSVKIAYLIWKFTKRN